MTTVAPLPDVLLDATPTGRSARLITLEDARAVEGLSTVEPGPQQPPAREPDPRGPCGGPSPGLPIQVGAQRVVANGDTRVTELVTDESPALDAWLDAQRADARPQCGSFHIENALGYDLEVSDVTFVALDAIVPDGLAYTWRVKTTGFEGYLGAVMVRRDGYFAIIELGTTREISVATLTQLARAAFDRLHVT